MEPFYYLGQICLFPYNFVPEGFIECAGQHLVDGEHPALYSLLGRRFIPPAEKDDLSLDIFVVPNLKEKAPPGMLYCICVSGPYPPRA